MDSTEDFAARHSSVLFVDDEEHMLKALHRLYRNEFFDAVFANSAEQALSVMKSQPISVIVADMRMPGRDGISLLSEVMETYPATARIMLSACSEAPELLAAINSGAVPKYFLKPIDEPERLRQEILHGIDDCQSKLLAATLTGPEDLERQILHVCSYCHKVRDDEEKWRELIEYLWSQLSVHFSHGVCPCCWKASVQPQLDALLEGETISDKV